MKGDITEFLFRCRMATYWLGVRKYIGEERRDKNCLPYLGVGLLAVRRAESRICLARQSGCGSFFGKRRPEWCSTSFYDEHVGSSFCYLVLNHGGDFVANKRPPACLDSTSFENCFDTFTCIGDTHKCDHRDLCPHIFILLLSNTHQSTFSKYLMQTSHKTAD